MKKVILVGGGHAHVFVLDYLIKNTPADVDVTIISPSAWQDYSGMLPGWMAGYYDLSDCRINVKALAFRANVTFIEDVVMDMRADESYVVLGDGRRLNYDILSLDIGSETHLGSLSEIGSGLVPIKPFDQFRDTWHRIVQTSQEVPNYKLIIVGGGAAGVELAFAARSALIAHSPLSKVTLVAGRRGVLWNHGEAVRRRVVNQLDKQGIHVISQRATGDSGRLLLDDGHVLTADHIIAATNSSPAQWLKQSQMALSTDGYVSVNAHHCSVSHANIFAAGNVCSREDINLERSGVHAVKAGPVLAHNIFACLEEKPLKSYCPGQRSLYLLLCSNHRAIASWGRYSAEGVWVWRIKNWIDRGFIQRFTLKP